ncbi:MAG: molecular chaperone HtpG [Acidobacteriota bacterium]
MSTTETPAADAAHEPQSYEFRAETRQLLDIVIHSLYSNKEIFLRELVSNASDALDRARLEALTGDGPALAEDETLEIRLVPEAEARTLRISDNGVGMSRDEVIENLGTIAKSGTRELAAKLKEAKDAEQAAELIGQFGVGFYSAFMVADRVEVVTRRAGQDQAVRWVSTGDGSYTLEDTHRFHRGTDVILHLKPVDEENGLQDFAAPFALEGIVKRHSDFVSYPIVLEATEPASTDDDADEAETTAETTAETKTERTLNSMQPIWTRSPSEVKDEEYTEFYRHIAHDWNEPLDTLRLVAEGRIEYKALLFLPEKAPFDLFYRDSRHGLQLYVRRVLIMDRCEELLPLYLRFVKGVVDSSDLPLNISREMVQHDRHIALMRKWLTKKVLEHLRSLQKDDFEKYLKLWKEFGKVLKEGVSGDPENRERLLPLLLFPSSAEPEKLVTFAEYKERMKDGQDAIYYAAGESYAAVESSPHLEAFRDKGIEVLYFTDPVDEILAQSVPEVDGTALRSVGKGEIELGDEEEKKAAEEKLEERTKDYADLLESLQKSLDDHVKEVRLSRRLTTSPVCLVAGEMDMSPHLERLLRQAEGMDLPKQKRILELNPEHELLEKLRARHGENAEDPVVGDYAELLYGQALLAEGSELPDPMRYTRLVSQLMTQGL